MGTGPCSLPGAGFAGVDEVVGPLSCSNRDQGSRRLSSMTRVKGFST